MCRPKAPDRRLIMARRQDRPRRAHTEGRDIKPRALGLTSGRYSSPEEQFEKTRSSGFLFMLQQKRTWRLFQSKISP